MPLRETLKDIVEKVEGAVAAVIMANDGISIDEYVVDEAGFDLQLLTVEYARGLEEVSRAAEVISIGVMEEVSITSSRLFVVIRVLNDDAFIMLVMTRDGNTGKGRHLLRLKSFELARELG